MKVYEALAQSFIDEGTQAVFGMMGDTNQHWINAISRRGANVYEVRHEGPALAMAEGMAFITGQPGVCSTTSGPGVTQLATQMVRAVRAHSPVIAFCGDERWGHVDHHHAFDQARFASAIECEFVRISSPATAYEEVQKAFYLARTQSIPVLVSAPLNTQMGTIEDDEQYELSSSLIITTPIYPNPSVLEEAADLIENSKHPVIVVGRGAMAANAGDVIQRLANRTGALVATSLMAMNWMRDDDAYNVGVSGLFSTRTAIELFAEADCVVAVGASLNYFTTAHGLLYPNAKVIQIDKRPQLIMGEGRPADCYIHGDARLTVELLDDVLEDRSFHQTGYRTPEVKEQLNDELGDSAEYELEEGTVDPRDAARILDELIPREIGLAIYSAHAAQVATMLCFRSRSYVLVNKHFGNMGSGIAAVIGTALGANAPAVLIDGDASAMMHLTEFETAVRYDIPILVVVMNDQALGAELHNATGSKVLDPELARISTPDLGMVGVAFGGRGHLVRTLDQLRSAVSEFVAAPGPMMIDIRISTNVESIQRRRKDGVDA